MLSIYPFLDMPSFHSALHHRFSSFITFECVLELQGVSYMAWITTKALMYILKSSLRFSYHIILSLFISVNSFLN